ncbi:hypothetical protein K503DRAFT_685940 [Rhizopogon vinicolor AM-OR11-026]|uniref:GIT Spa2 homology (SHD) domain-containing protein n=1 Tax=Rhizopogon vinicolor AM-OR11-026 TaxID=1314800 RepID=A0A1B7N8N9_9AGAM|nr:hypothetical protein K503DRAFT_685940 [Rhizopogon vinicolor AM-OR11-026]
MNRSRSSRTTSPTPTTFSGISNYRTESYRPIRDKGSVPALPSVPKATARTHFDELASFLVSYLAKGPQESRAHARSKLTNLTKQQFHELSTDVYDELVRRRRNNSENDVPFLPVRDEFHPKRNQARQKLATLPSAKFEDLCSDVYFEIMRRYPEFTESENLGMASPASAYDDVPSPEFHTSPRPDIPILPHTTRIGRSSEDRGSAREDEPRRSEDAYAPRQQASMDYGADFGRRPSGSASIRSDSTGTTNAQSATATSGMVIPNKSTIAEEDIEVPYGREMRESSGTAIDPREGVREVDTTDGEHESWDQRAAIGGLSGLSARLKSVQSEDDDMGDVRSDEYDKVSLGRASVTSDRSIGGPKVAGQASVTGDEQERLRRDYEFKIATMQNRITSLERDLEQRDLGTQQTTRRLEEELEGFRKASPGDFFHLTVTELSLQRAEEHGSAMRTMQRELDDLRDLRAREKEREIRRAQADEEELQILRDRCERLEEERNSGVGIDNSEIIEQLRADLEGLIAELSDLSRRNDELMTAKDSDLTVIRDLDSQLKEYKRKYEQAKTELRSVKATSQLFLQAPKMEDQLPMAPDGGLLDIHVTAFVSAIDGLLTAGRSSAPTRVLVPMKAVVTSTTAITDDVRAYEQRPPHADVDLEVLRSLRERAEATLTNLVAASKTHATSSGMSPVSLLDAAASHVSVTLTEIAKMIYIRKANRAEQEEFLPTSSSGSLSYASGRSTEDMRPVYKRKASELNTKRSEDVVSPPMSAASRFAEAHSRRTPSEPSSSLTSSPPPIFDKSPITSALGGISDDSAPPEGGEDAWSELKPYLEAQTEAIVYAIQSVLSGVRSPVPPLTLNENVTQIITIVSSIVSVCRGNLPPGSAQQAAELLRELGEHARKLSEVQSLPEVTKESRQVMAKSSFAVANAMKGLMKL